MIQIDRIQKDLESLAEFTATPGQGTTRLSYSVQAKQTRQYLKSAMKDAGLTVREDALGNIFGRLSHAEIDEQPIVLVGSHFDSVPNGGMFDGPAGIVAGLEVARLFHEQQLKLSFPLEIVALVEEEGSSFNSGLLASRALCGLLSYKDLQTLADQEGNSAAAHMENAGYFPKEVEMLAYPKHKLKAFLELHIEQGPILENLNKDIGIVDVIVGIAQMQVTIEGRADHAGTTPMNLRSDALVAASRIVTGVEDIASQAGQGCVATVGRLNVYPNGANVIPEQVKLTVDVRASSKVSLDQMITHIQSLIYDQMHARIVVDIQSNLYISPTELSPKIMEELEAQSEKLNISYESMVSGAGHDAMIFTTITDVGLIFVPSSDGISHHPDEWTDYEKLGKGVQVLYETVKALTESKES